MERLRRFVQRQQAPAYEPLIGDSAGNGDQAGAGEGEQREDVDRPGFSWLIYGVFCLLGVAMLWAWNMFLAAAPYFQKRFASDEWIQVHFLSAIMLVFTITNLSSILVLTKLQANASYPKRITSALLINIMTFALLMLSTVSFKHAGAGGYFTFTLVTVFAASLATGFCQNGVFAFVAGFGRPEYTQAIMVGQAVAGVLPCIAQIVSVLSIPQTTKAGSPPVGEEESSKSAFLYFLASTAVSAVTLAAFFSLLARRRESHVVKASVTNVDGMAHRKRASVGMWTLFVKLRWLALAVSTCFAVTMVFPVFTKAILSVRPPDSAPRIFEPACFIPLAFLFWNAGDLLGRLLTLIPHLTLIHRPQLLFIFSLLRLLFIPLYLTCNLHGHGAVINSDLFYLFVVQLGFGVTNGWLGSSCMMGAARYVAPEEREAAGGFMSLMLVTGLTVGSLLSFFVAGA